MSAFAAPARALVDGVPMTREPSARLHGWASVHDLVCPRGHHIRTEAIIFEHGAIRCGYRKPLPSATGRRDDVPAGYGPECGAWMYVLGSIGWNVVRDAAGHDQITLGDDVYLVEVDRRELTEIRARRLNASAVLAYLGLPRLASVRRR